jgi:cytochrome c553
MRQPTNRWASIGSIAFASALLVTGCFGGIDGMDGNLQDDPGADDPELPPDDVPLDDGVKAQFEAEVDPILRAQCIRCHAVVGNINYPPFVTATLADSYSTVSSTSALMGTLTPAGAPILTKITGGAHHGATYTADDIAAIEDFLAAQLDTGGTPTPPDESPGAISARLVSDWSGCLSVTDFEELQFGEMWGNKGSDEGNCEQCHTTGNYGFVATDDNSTMYEKLSGMITNSATDMFGYFTVDVPNEMMVINMPRFEMVATGQGIHINHPRFDYSPNDPAMQVLQELYNRTAARQAAGACGTPILPP